MIRIQLYKGDRLVDDTLVADADAAHTSIDRMLSDVHHDKHGGGDFSLFADHVNEINLFVGHFYTVAGFSHPARSTVS